MSKTQNETILQYLKKGNALTSLEALDLFGCFRLASRISDLKKMGIDIRDDFVSRNGKSYKKYWIHDKEKKAPDMFMSEDAIRQHEWSKA